MASARLALIEYGYYILTTDSSSIFAVGLASLLGRNIPSMLSRNWVIRASLRLRHASDVRNDAPPGFIGYVGVLLQIIVLSAATAKVGLSATYKDALED